MATIPSEEKVFMVSNGTNTTYSGSASLKAMQEWYTMQDVSDTVMPYKVFTALLTQSGGDNVLTQNSGAVTKGVTYFIDAPGPLADFTNVGAPANAIDGTFFVAINNEIPNNYDGAILEYNTGAPVANVLENTIGDIWFTYYDIGNYRVNSNGLFTSNKTASINNLTRCINGGDGFYNLYIYQSDIDNVLIVIQNDSGESVDDQLYQKMIEIRVYN